MMKRGFGLVLGTLLVLVTAGLFGQPFSTPIQQAIALLTSGTTPFSIVGINANGYINWGTGRSATGYGFRDNAGTIESKNLAGAWAPLSTSGGAPSTATYITQTPNGSLSNEQALSLLASAILVNTTTTGVIVPYGGTSCTNQIFTAINAVGVATCGNINLGTIGLTGALAVIHGGTGLTTVTTGDILYASAANTISALAKDTNATRYLSNTGTANIPAWAQINVANGVTGTLGVANGGTGLTAGTSGGILGFTAPGTLASSVVLTANRIVLGGGAGATPTVLGSLGTATTVLHGNVGGAPSFGLVDLSTDTTGSIGVAQGGTGIASYAIGDIIYASAATTLSKLADVSAGSFLRSGGITTAPAWSTTKWPNSATTGDVLYASGTNQYANLADVAAGSYLRAGGVGTAPVWSTATLPNTATTGDLIAATGANVYGNITALGTGRVLSSMGVGTLPAFLTNPSSTTFEVSTAFIGPGTEADAGVIRLANTSQINARNNGDSGNLVLLTSNASDFVVQGSSGVAGFQRIIGTANLYDLGGIPTISSGFGTAPSIAGNASRFRVTVGAGGDTSGVVLFNDTWPNAPICVANDETISSLLQATPTTTQVTIGGTMAASDVISVMCGGY